MATRCAAILRLTLTALAAVGCGDPVRDNPLDQKRCEIPCGKGEMCRDGACVKDPCPEGLVHVKKQKSAQTDFCISPVESSRQGQSTANIKAGNTPWVNLLPGEAWAACRAAGFSLCDQDQWSDACGGRESKNNENAPDGEQCKGKALHLTGQNAGCEGGFTGIFDLLGNAAEWVIRRSSSEPVFSGHGVMGGSYQNGQFDCSNGQSEWGVDDDHSDRGFRCCVPCDKSGATCAASREWFQYSVRGTGSSGSGQANATGMWGRSTTDIWMLMGSGVAHYDGHSWSLDKDIGKTNQTTAIDGLPDGKVWVVVDAKVHYHDGTSWSELKPQSLNLNTVHDVSVKTATSVYIVADNSGAGNNTVFRWDGKDWNPVGNHTESANTLWVNRATGTIWVGGQDGKHARYNGATWEPINSQTGDHFADIHGTADDNVWAVGTAKNSSDLLVVKYAAKKWQPQPTNHSGSPAPNHVLVLDKDQVWISGDWAALRDKSGKWNWMKAQLPGAVWVPEPSKPNLVWVGPIRYY